MTPEPSDAHIMIQCLDVEATMPPDVASNGILVLDSRVEDGSGRYKNFDTYFMNMVTRTTTQVAEPRQNLEEFAVSPDRKWIAYSDSRSDENVKTSERSLVIAADGNQEYKVLPWDDAWGSINWLDNQRLIIQKETRDNPNDIVAIASTFLVLDPFTGGQQTLQPDFPGIYDVPPLPIWDGWGETVYDPTLTRVVYLQGDVSGPFYYVLWDTQNSKQVSDIQIIGELSAIPRWSPDGKQFTLAPSLFENGQSYPSYELYSIDRDGKTTRLTYLTDYYPRVYIDDFSWSPDGRYIAFWFSSWQDTTISYEALGNRYLAVLDTANGWVTNYCINGENDASIGLRIYPPPLWSPDSKQVVVQSQVSKNYFQTVLVDVKESRAFIIAEDLAPVGWITTP